MFGMDPGEPWLEYIPDDGGTLMSDFDSLGSTASFMDHFSNEGTVDSPLMPGFGSPFGVPPSTTLRNVDPAMPNAHISLNSIHPLTTSHNPDLISTTTAASMHQRPSSQTLTISPSRLSSDASFPVDSISDKMTDGISNDLVTTDAMAILNSFRKDINDANKTIPAIQTTKKTLAATKNNNNASTISGAIQLTPQGSNGTLKTMGLSLSSPSISHDSPLTGTSSSQSGDHGHSQSTHPRRDAHMASEQRRRAIMRDSFERLQQLLPPSEYRKPSKANLLQAAVSYISYLKQQDTTLRAKVQWLAREKAILVQQIQGSSMVQYPNKTNGTGLGKGGSTYGHGSDSSVNVPPIAPALPKAL